MLFLFWYPLVKLINASIIIIIIIITQYFKLINFHKSCQEIASLNVWFSWTILRSL
jgi:hypothetical protein